MSNIISSWRYTLLTQNEDSDVEDERCIDEKELSTDLQLFEIKQRNQEKRKKKEVEKRPQEHFIIHKLQKTDTLNSLALKCNCSVSDLKRANGLVADQEFYGLSHIKIPIKKYSLLTDVMVHQVNSDSNFKGNTPANNQLIVNIGLQRTLHCNDTEDMKRFLYNLERDLAQIRKVASNYPKSDNVKEELNSTNIVKNEYYCDGADCGFQWTNVILIALILLVFVPMLYAFVVMSHNHSSDT